MDFTVLFIIRQKCGNFPKREYQGIAVPFAAIKWLIVLVMIIKYFTSL